MTNFLTDHNKSPIADFHAIVTDHPRMMELGLGVFTTGDLNTWLHTLKQPPPVLADGIEMPKEFYSNWAAINHTDIDTLLGDNLRYSDNWGSFEAWRRHGATGKYEHQEWDDWSWSLIGHDVQFSEEVLLFDSFWLKDGVVTHLKPSDETINWEAKKVTPTSNGRNFFKDVKSPILQIIEMNFYMNQIRRFFPRTEWSESQHELTEAKLVAMDNFLTDIKASKHGCVEFSAKVPFNINLANGGILCDKEETVNYKLYLYDDSKMRNTAKVAVLKDPKIGGYKRDTTGRAYRATNDGEVTPANISNPADQAIGDLERFFNPFTMKWESGTQNVFAKVVTHINAAVNNPSVESLENSDIKADLDGDENRHFAPSSGLVMPIEIQNANPMQWQPNYARTSGCREEDKEKATVVGFNHNPLKSYPRDTLVMLSKIGGVWHITDMGSGISPEDRDVPAVFEGKWQFQYLATNSNSFFTSYRADADGNIDQTGGDDRGDGVSIPSIRIRDGSHAEVAFHRDYYWDDDLNGGQALDSPYNEYHDLEKGLVGGELEILWTKMGGVRFFATRGWWQFTSFDFMDDRIGGTHDGNYIASTNCLTDSALRSTERPPSVNPRGAGSTGGFFGCVFPDGYRRTGSSTFFGSARNFVIRAASNHGDTPGAFGASLFDTTSLSRDPAVQPFLDPNVALGVDPDSPQIPLAQGGFAYTPERSRQRAMLGGDFSNPDIGFTEGGGHFSSLSEAYAPSMFYSETHNNNRNLRQLPADIGTLSSPDGRFGCPIQNIHALDILHGEMKGDTLKPAVSDIFKERYWLCRSDTEANRGLGVDNLRYKDTSTSAYGFRPTKMNKIMFRPLKVGTYTQFFPEIGTYLENHKVGHRSLPRGNWSAEVVRQYHFTGSAGRGPIASPKSKARELDELAKEGLRAGTVPEHLLGKKLLYSEHKGLLLRGDIYRFSDSSTNNSHFYYPSYGERVHDKFFWTQEIFNQNTTTRNQQDGLPEEKRGANAFGVIGAVCTTTANNQIAFSTDNRIGMMCESKRGNNTAYLDPIWGGSDTDYYTNRTTELHAMIYHAHPRSQTIYDPRYFAVHHFNPHVMDEDNNPYRSQPGLVNVTFRQYTGGDDFQDVVNKIQSRSTTADGKIDQANRKYEYDLAEPTKFGPPDGNAITCEVEESVFRDGHMHSEDNWNLNSKRLGKLLPYRYTVKVLGAPWPVDNHVQILEDDGTPLDTFDAQHSYTIGDNGVTAESLKDKMVIISPGENYEPGNMVGNAKMGVLFSVEEVGNYTDPEDGETITGGIKTLKLISLGNVATTSCSRSDDIIMPNTPAGYTIVNAGAQGTGFSAFFVNAKVAEETRIDHKPRVVGDDRTIRLSAGPDGGGTQSAQNVWEAPIYDLSGYAALFGIGGGGGSATSNQVGSDFGIVYQGVDRAVTIDPDYKSPNNKYDIFLHFHNDITHTWMDPEYGDGENSEDVDEQHITTEITAI